jgi:hypothetical protein
MKREDIAGVVVAMTTGGSSLVTLDELQEVQSNAASRPM